MCNSWSHFSIKWWSDRKMFILKIRGPLQCAILPYFKNISDYSEIHYLESYLVIHWKLISSAHIEPLHHMIKHYMSLDWHGYKVQIDCWAKAKPRGGDSYTANTKLPVWNATRLPGDQYSQVYLLKIRKCDNNKHWKRRQKLQRT